VPFLFGDYIAKFSLVPASPALQALKGTEVDLHDKPDGLRLAVEDYFATQSGEWDLRVQLCTDVKSMPVEDASVVWPEDESHYLTVARLSVAPHAAQPMQARHQEEDALFFSPWQGLAAHRPLGSINRVRRIAYEASGRARAERSGCPFPHG